VSVILDALRRRRTGSGQPGTREQDRAVRPIPAGLGLNLPQAAPESRPSRARRWVVAVTCLALAALVVVLVKSLWWPATPRASHAPQVVTETSAPAESRTPSQAAPLAPADVAKPQAPASRSVPVSPREFDLAVRQHSLGRFDEARTHYLAALASDEFNVEARNNLGLLYYEHQRPEEAIEQFRRATLTRPEYVKARSNLAVVLTSVGRTGEARAELRAAMDRAPRSADLCVNMALVEKADHNPDAAIDWLGRALGYEPTHTMAHYNLAVLYDESGQAALASEHYRAFVTSSRPEHGALLEQVERRLQSFSEDPPTTTR